MKLQSTAHGTRYTVHSRTTGGSDFRYFSRRFHSSVGTEQRFGTSGFLFAHAAQVFGTTELLFGDGKLLCDGKKLLSDAKKLLCDSVKLLFATEKLLFGDRKLLFRGSEQHFFSPSLPCGHALRVTSLNV
ncbi:MAG: hypothetical protein WD135_09880 [Ferruginibacter sp.]